ncbi:MAG: hypothetical protein BWY86_00992 [Candidatus Aminicenantes bacterium ADurb.Bin508]|nr:MAG: hypothetical protein BWY86_00992 [Candidatus Aminicenantes bacterium ADurb.Bin508]
MKICYNFFPSSREKATDHEKNDWTHPLHLSLSRSHPLLLCEERRGDQPLPGRSPRTLSRRMEPPTEGRSGEGPGPFRKDRRPLPTLAGIGLRLPSAGEEGEGPGSLPLRLGEEGELFRLLRPRPERRPPQGESGERLLLLPQGGLPQPSRPLREGAFGPIAHLSPATSLRPD